MAVRWYRLWHRSMAVTWKQWHFAKPSWCWTINQCPPCFATQTRSVHVPSSKHEMGRCWSNYSKWSVWPVFSASDLGGKYCRRNHEAYNVARYQLETRWCEKFIDYTLKHDWPAGWTDCSCLPPTNGPRSMQLHHDKHILWVHDYGVYCRCTRRQ
jgi:hypothetical protein